MRTFGRTLAASVLVLAFGIGGTAHGDVRTDGSVGPIVELSGPHLEIPASLGSQRGANLFHSFERFNVETNGSATFTAEGAQAPIEHVIARIIGGAKSSIDGVLRSTIGERSLVLINPAGIAFGSGARLDVPGAFRASTADSLRFDDGFELTADPTPLGAGGAAAPSLLRFTSGQPETIDVSGYLQTARSFDLSFIGGDLSFTSAWALSNEGRIALVALASPGEVRGVFERDAEVVVSGAARLGRIVARDSVLSSSGILEFEDQLGRPFDSTTFTKVARLCSVDLGTCGPNARFVGHTNRDLYLEAKSFDLGSGDIWVRARDMRLVDTELRALNPGGVAGSIDIDLSGDLRVDRGVTNEFESGIFTGGIPFFGELTPIYYDQNGQPQQAHIPFRAGLGGVGAAGAIRISADDVELRGGATIASVSFSSGEGGAISIDARGDMLVSGTDASGRARGLFSSAQGSGDAGDISIRARTLRLDHGGALIAQTTENGDAGKISVDVERLVIRDGAQIDSSTSAQALAADAPTPSTGNGGSICVHASTGVSIYGVGSDGSASRISTFSQARTIGRAGSITVDTPHIDVGEHGEISVRSSGAGPSGEIRLDVDRLSLHGGAEISARADGSGDAGVISISARDRVELDHASITTAAPKADGGDITIRAGERVVLQDSEITASVGGGTGGSIDIDPRFVVLNGSRVVAQAGEGEGGRITVQAEQYLRSVGSVVDATSRAGIDGTVVISAPDANLSNELASLPEAYLDASDLIAEHCAARRSGKPGSFVQRGRGGTPDSPQRARPARQQIGGGVPAPSAQRRGDRAEELEHWSAVLATSDDARVRAAAWLELAQAHESAGDVASAGQALDRASGEAELAGAGPTAQAAIAGVRGRLEARAGDASGALRDLQGAVPTAAPAGAAALRLDYANLLTSSGLGDQADFYYAESERLARDAGEPGIAALAVVDRARSADDVERAVRALDELPVTHETLFARLHVARKLGAERRLRAAELYASTAALAEDLDDPLTASYAWGWLGAEYAREGRNGEARQLFARALAAAQRAEAAESLYLWQWELGRSLRSDGDLAGALRALRAANDSLSVLRVAFALDGASQREVAREFPVDPVVRDLVDVLLQTASQTEDPVDRAALLAEARRRLEDLNATELQDYFEDECVATQRRAAPETVPGTLVVHPVILEDRLELIVALPGETRAYAVPVGAEALAAQVKRFRQNVQERSSRAYVRDAEQLYEWLVRPLERDLERARPETLIWVSSGSLRGLPLAALRDSRTGTFLIERYALALAPGLTLTDPQPIDRARTRALKAGLSEGVRGFPPLANVPAELEAVGQSFAGPTLLDGDFVAARVDETLAREPFGIVHVASHAEFGRDISDAFILTFEEKLGIDRLSELVGVTRFRDQPLELLTLSACRTAAGDERSALGLAGVAVKAGARSTLASLWYIEDEAASRLVAHFYRELATPGVSRALALQRAQKALLAEPRFARPVSWAPFILIGSWL